MMSPKMHNFMFITIVLILAGTAWYKIYELSKQHLKFNETGHFVSKNADAKPNLDYEMNQSEKQLSAQETKFKILQEQLNSEQEENNRLAREIEQLNMAMDVGEVHELAPFGETSEEQELSEKIALIERKQVRIARYEQVLSEGEQDANWHKTITERLDELLNQLGENHTVIAEVDCTTTVCRIDLEYQDEAAMHAFANTLPLLSPNSAEIYFDHSDFQDGIATGVIYLAKQDVNISALDS